ncbi:bifunctional UDP-N-acetylmuramoyl-tripeptide:D-alanyl-D-alanine ligase/alanine racemase [Sphingobacterium sp. HJSM2_6]|uniref:bifunctional UDP-N-acetylmuramoyl-tripeptide:D-alanyl-D-alanine ligase/alanine racemase n=1 Tax=Sphingobacterium sp. HJSM2_6 TaxID=3366264 RepID=UPI003BCC181D
MMYTIDFILKLFAGDPFKIFDKDHLISELVYDSRKVLSPAKGLFFALQGVRDGHDFLKDAYDQGIRSFIVSKVVPVFQQWDDVNVIRVEDVLQAMQHLVQHHRERFNYPIIGITGSNGKSIVKEWLFQLLSPDQHVYQSPKSYNSQLGVALSLWNLSDHYDIALIEAGISQPGEMQNLEKMIQPAIGVFTNIGMAHALNFESKEQKLNEKLKLFQHAQTLIAGSTYIQQQQLNQEVKLITWGSQNTDHVQLISEERIGQSTQLNLRVSEELYSFLIPFSDKAAKENVLSCIAVLFQLGYSMPIIIERIQHLRPLEMRMQLKKGIKGCSLIDDSYSNDIASLGIALDFLKQQNQHPKQTIILSELEGLKESEKMQSKLKDLLSAQAIARLIWVGSNFSWLNELPIADLQVYKDTYTLVQALHQIPFANESILIKGARKYEFEKLVQQLSLRSHGTVLEINLNALSNNLNTYRSLIPPDVKVMAMVKAFSYGSGSFEVANLLQFHQVDYLTVAFVDEGVELRSAGIKLPIMVLSPDPDTFDSLLKHQLEPEVYSMEFLLEFISFLKLHAVKNYPIHLKLDTGMHRLGFFPEEIPEVIEHLSQQEEIHVQSFFTHLVASGDAKHDEFTQSQLSIFNEAAEVLAHGLGYSFIKHAANTSGIVKWPQSHLDMVRLGIGLYGIDMDKKLANLEQVSSLKTTVSQIKKLSKGETVGYNRSGVLLRDSLIATVKIGYADGYNRKFGHAVGQMMIQNQLVPTVGVICMDMCMLDITGMDVQVGDEVLVFPDIYVAAKAIDTIPYELLVNISSRVKRVYFYE